MNVTDKYTVAEPDALRNLCIRKNWFTEGTNAQYEKLFYANEHGCPIEEIATIIWLCTDCEEYVNEYGTHWCRRDILDDLKEAREIYYQFCNYERR